MEIQLRSATDFDAEQLAGLFCSCFAGHVVPLHVDAAAIGHMVRRDSVNLARSCVAVRAGQAVGFLLLALRGRGARVAAMGVLPEARRTGLGRRMLDHAVQESRAAGCTELVLEVITANEPAVGLYQATGFRRVHTLLGFTSPSSTACPSPTSNETTRPRIDTGTEHVADGGVFPARTTMLRPTDAGVVADWIARHGRPNPPWQLAADTIAAPLPGHTAFEWPEHAATLISDPSKDRIALLSLVVARDRRRRGVGRAVLNELIHLYPGRTWRVPEVVPAGEATAFLAALGWQASAIQQYLMTLQL